MSGTASPTIDANRMDQQVRRLRWMLRSARLVAAAAEIGGAAFLARDPAATERESAAINLVERQKMLGQRIAKNLLTLMIEGKDTSIAAAEPRATINKFSRAQSSLDRDEGSLGFVSDREDDEQQIIAGKQAQSFLDLVPPLALAAHAMKGGWNRCLRAGMDEHTSKPISGREMTRIIDRVFAIHHPRRAAA
jgi:CheY-like chemotaxis protein